MKVILLQDIETLGKKYDFKNVKSGYARNFLIPRKLVKQATKESVRWAEEQKKLQVVQAEEELKKIQGVASTLDGTELSIIIKVGEEGQVFDSVNSQKIADKLKEAGFNVKKSQINLEKPIKELGEFPVKISLDHNLEAEITVIITPEKNE